MANNPPPSIQDATLRLTEALHIVRQAAEDYVTRYGEGDPRKLLRIVRSNQSNWSGGANNADNIIEKIVCDTATGALENLHWYKLLKPTDERG